MNSIKTKIILAFSLILFILAVLVTSIVLVEFNLVDRYKKSNETIIYEQTLKTDVSLLAEYGYNAFKTHDYDQYNAKLSEVNKTESILNTRLSDNSISDETKLAYRSLKNSLNTVVGIISNAKTKLERSGDIVGISAAFTDANNKFEFVKQNINDLLIIETSNISNTTQEITKIQTVVRPAVVISIIVIFFILIIFSLFFARSITDPIIILSKTVEDIISGKTNIKVKNELLERPDEIGSLSISFDIMMKKLNEKILGLESSDKDLRAAVLKLNEQIDETSRLNKLMVGRELKMIELKEEIKKLKDRLENKT
jgi:methyl-accepting chemotaxis protein